MRLIVNKSQYFHLLEQVTVDPKMIGKYSITSSDSGSSGSSGTLGLKTESEVSNYILKFRDLWWSKGGIIAQAVASTLLVEIGGPLIVGAIDVVIMINDLYLCYKNWKPAPQNLQGFDWFAWHYTNSKYFINVLEDILFIVTGGLIKLVGKTSSSIYKIVMEKLGLRSINELSTKIKPTWLNKLKDVIPNLPKKIGTFFQKIINDFEKFISIFTQPKQTLKTMKKQIIPSIISGTIAYGGWEAFEKYLIPKIEVYMKTIQDKIHYSNLENSMTAKEFLHFKNKIEKDNPWLGDIKTIKFKRENEKIYWQINGIWYKKGGKGFVLTK